MDVNEILVHLSGTLKLPLRLKTWIKKKTLDIIIACCNDNYDCCAMGKLLNVLILFCAL